MIAAAAGTPVSSGCGGGSTSTIVGTGARPVPPAPLTEKKVSSGLKRIVNNAVLVRPRVG